MPADSIKNEPLIFISYSHDNTAHKQWVADLGSKLLKNGINVILDQWDLEYGDDIPKFMENSVTKADRVLMICTETYVKKADEGEGGVGYEAMIVTGELIQNLGTRKFIPVIRQHSENIILPKSVTTRFAVNLSEQSNIEENFKNLVRQIHREQPPQKPTFFKKNSEEIKPDKNHKYDLKKGGEDLNALYDSALNIIREDDIKTWRNIISQAKQPLNESLLAWRKKWEPSFNSLTTTNQQYDCVLEGISPYAQLISIALAGVESGKQKFNNQIGIVDDILSLPKGWVSGGYTAIVNFEETIVYVYQALHGGLCLHTSQLDQALQLIKAKFNTKDNIQKQTILKPNYISRPTIFLNSPTFAWAFLKELPKKWLWLEKPFSAKDDFIIALSAYYLALNVFEFINLIISGNEKAIIDKDIISLSATLSFLLDNDENIERQAYRLFTNDPKQVKNIWNNLGIENSRVSELWPYWVTNMEQWVRSWKGQERPLFQKEIVHKYLMDDIN